MSSPHGTRVHFAGAVICRQRPGTAKGVTFLTLEDETGFVNVVMWKKVWERYRIVVKTNPLLGISGRVESQQDVVHLIAEHAWVPKLRRAPAESRSYDFH